MVASQIMTRNFSLGLKNGLEIGEKVFVGKTDKRGIKVGIISKVMAGVDSAIR